MGKIKARHWGRVMNLVYKMTATRFILFSFAFIILVGTGLLMLPIASRSGEATPFINSLFTATSATCITGLIVYDTYSYWSSFGQMVIIFLIQIGGLGIMSLAATISFLFGRKISLKERLLMAQSINLEDNQGIVRLMRKVIFGTLLFEGLGAIILSIRFIPQFGVSGGIIKGIFHSVAAFCNAGFDLMGEIAPYSSMTTYVSDFTVNLTIMALIIIGGLGFYVWNDLWHFKNIKSLRLHTKIVLIVTAALIFGGALMFYLLEKDGVLAELDWQGKLLAPFFQSVTARTAGFNSVDQAALTDGSKLVTILLMFIGGSPGSTAGGIKTVTFGVMIIAVLSVARGSKDVNVFGRRIDMGIVLRALSIVLISISVLVISVLVLCITEGKPMLDLLFEAVSAFGTVGMTTGITTELTSVGKMIIIFLMFFGRVGVLTTAVALASRQKYDASIQFPEEKVLIG